jgi:hypothetical protein
MNELDLARAKLVEELIRDVWSSLESHLAYVYIEPAKGSLETREFHKECVQSYSEMIVKLTKLY